MILVELALTDFRGNLCVHRLRGDLAIGGLVIYVLILRLSV